MDVCQLEILTKAKIESYLRSKQEEEQNPGSSTPGSEGRTGKGAPSTSTRDTNASTQVCTITAYIHFREMPQECFYYG